MIPVFCCGKPKYILRKSAIEIYIELKLKKVYIFMLIDENKL